MKSPLASHDFLTAPIEAQPFTVDQRLMKKRGMRLSRKPSPVPSAEKWWMETMKQRQNDGPVRITPYEYPPFPSYGGLEGPEFLPIPIKYRKPNKKSFKRVHRPVESAELERVSENPPEFLPSEVVTLEVRRPQVLLRQEASGEPNFRFRKNDLKVKKVPAAAYNMRSERLESIISESDESDVRKPVIPDKMLGNDMLFHHNRLEEVERSGNDVDDPNDDFELIQ